MSIRDRFKDMKDKVKSIFETFKDKITTPFHKNDIAQYLPEPQILEEDIAQNQQEEDEEKRKILDNVKSMMSKEPEVANAIYDCFELEGMFDITDSEVRFKYTENSYSDDKLYDVIKNDGLINSMGINKNSLKTCFNSRINQIEERVKDSGIKDFYGPPNFMIQRTEKIIKDSYDMLHDYGKSLNSKDKENILDTISNLQDKLNQMNSVLINKDSSNLELNGEEYGKFQQCFKEVLNNEEQCKKVSLGIWQKELTPVDKFQQGKPFKFLVHTLTSGEFEPDEVYKVPKVCTQLITENHISTPYGEGYGFIYDMNEDNFVMSCGSDAGSWVCDYDKVGQSHGLRSSWQSNEKLNDDKFIFFEESNISKIMCPKKIEEQSVKDDIEVNGEMLNYDKHVMYNETLLKSCYPIGVFCVTSGMNESAKATIEKAEKLAEKFKLPKPVTIDKSIYREQLGMEPLTEKEQQKLTSREKFKYDLKVTTSQVKNKDIDKDNERVPVYTANRTAVKQSHAMEF